MFKLLSRLGTAAAVGVLAVVGPNFAHAGFGLPTPSNQSLTGTSNTTGAINSLAGNIINIVFLIAGVLAVLYLLWSGIQYITAGGNADKVKAARQGIINAVIGIVVIMAAFFIIRLATSTRGVFDNNGATNGGGGGTGSTTGSSI
jgi:hypothetical protein